MSQAMVIGPTLTKSRHGFEISISAEQYSGLVASVCRAVRGISRQDAEDAVQEAWLVLNDKAETLSPGPIGGYLFGIARYKAMQIRDRRHRETSLDGLVELAGDSVEELVDRRDSAACEHRLELVEAESDPIAARVLDAVRMGGAKCLAQRGTLHRNSKYSDEQVAMVRRLRAEGYTYGRIEAETGVDRGYCSMLVHRRSRALVSDEGWTRELALAAIRRYARKHGSPPRHRDAPEHLGLPSPNTVARLFGSWRNGVREAGLVPVYDARRMQEWSRGEMIQALCGWRIEHGRWPTGRDLGEDPTLPSPATANRRLGSSGGRGLAQAVISLLE